MGFGGCTTKERSKAKYFCGVLLRGILASSLHVNACGGSAFYVVLVRKLYADGCLTGDKAVSDAYRNAAQKPESACLI